MTPLSIEWLSIAGNRHGAGCRQDGIIVRHFDWGRTMMRRMLLLAVLVTVASCTGAEPESKSGNTLVVECEEPRQKACPRIVEPVCATRDNGVRCVTTPCDSTETATYSNACTACADPAVFRYRDGACDD